MTMFNLDGKKGTKEEVEKYASEYGFYVDWDMISGDDDVDLTTMWTINSENTQKLHYAIIPAEDEQYEEARKELTLTTRYHDWRNTIADRILAQSENEDTEDYLDGMEEYNNHISAINKYGDKAFLTEGMSREEVIETTKNNA